MSWTELEPMLAWYDADPGPFCLATLVRVMGSSYRQQGARMLMNASRRILGSLSPGCLEDEVAARGAEVMRLGKSELMRFDLRIRFGCDGTILVAVERVAKPNAFFQSLQRCLRERKPVLAAMQGLDGPVAALHTEIISEPISIKADAFTQVIPPPVRLVLIGDRPDLQPLIRLGGFLCWEVRVVEDPSDLPAGDLHAGCVVMSHRLGADLAALQAALAQGYGYVALVGGRQRRER
ncbi:MAG: XdhC family protein, partial [Verrucomicrobia bacterium]|nr:XdhC family protein [Verrucomicrobiota bacterium]